MSEDEKMQGSLTTCNDEPDVDEARSPESRNSVLHDRQRSTQEIKSQILTQLTTEELKGNRRYKMNHSKRGIALIFTHGIFERRSLSPLPGSAKDGSVLSKTMKSLGFEVHLHQDKTWSDMKDILIQVIKKDHTDHDCLFVAIMTHGNQSGMLEARDFSYNAEEVWDCFKAVPSLAGKPKIFIFQACRGGRKEEGDVVLPSSVQRCFIIPSYADYLMAYSCLEGYSSYMDQKDGSWFIQDLCKDLDEYSLTEDMLSILTHTLRRAAYTRFCKTEGNDKNDRVLQMPFFSSTFTKLLYFYETSQ